MSISQPAQSAVRRHGTTLWLVVGVVLAGLAGGAIYWLAGALAEDGPPAHPAPPAVPTAVPWFRDVTADSGVQFTYRNGEEARQFAILEATGGGVALLDYDGDGLLDIFVTGGGYFDGAGSHTTLKGHPCKLYKNLGNCKFQDVTEAVGLARDWPYAHGAAVADYDRDGWPDLLVTGYGKIALLHNEADANGGRRFVDVTEKLGLRDSSWCTSAGWADLDGDGWPDLYICHFLDWSLTNNPVCDGYVPGIRQDLCPPERFKPLKHGLWHNDKGKAFRDVSDAHGFVAAGSGLGVVLADCNDDGKPDIFVGNDGNPNFLYLNRSPHLHEGGLLAGVAVDDNGHPTGSMGVDAGDYDGSGRPSLWVTNYQGQMHSLYRNLGGEHFEYVSRRVGIPSLGLNLVGFGTSFLDADNDGWEDLVIVNGHVIWHPSQGSTREQRPVLLRNVDRQGRRYFQDVSQVNGPFFQTPALGRGLAVGDLDNDGWPDVVVSHINTPVVILRNEAALAAPAHWLGLQLVGRGHRDVVGSTAIVECAGRKLTRFAKGGGSFLSASDRRLLFGLGTATTVGRVTVRWSWGATQVWEGLQPGRYYQLREDEAAARPLPVTMKNEERRM